MNIAFVITGYVRRNYLGNLHKIIGSIPSDWNIDFYGAIWDKTENGQLVPPDVFYPVKSDRIQRYSIDSYNNNKTSFQLDYDRQYPIEFILNLSKADIFAHFMDVNKEKERGTHCGFTNEAVEYWFNRIKDQYYLIQKGFELVKNDYDLLFRIRTDFHLLKKFPISSSDKINMISGYDCFQYGTPKEMMIYSKLYENIDKFSEDMSRLNRFGYDSLNAENTLRHYLKINNVQINEMPWVEGQEFILGR